MRAWSITGGAGLLRVFEPVDRTLSLLAAAFRLVYAAVFMVAIGRLLGPSADREAFSELWLVGLGLFGVHLVLLGYLTVRTTSWLAVLLTIAGLGYLADAFGAIFGQDLAVATYTFVGEVVLAFWLLLKRPASSERARAVAGAGETDGRAVVG
ncbi:DUF4386 domain-containing protein [Kribbella sp. NPDC050124]|uniref:DUF4386 domain-containing protein n=1 Tax=Kribbella sp. NPDC050124 TaxID=3364114 RepID=UPI0037943242